MTEENNTTSNNQGFLTGFLIGSMVSGLGFYLTMTKAGRKMAREILRKAEELGDKGEDYLKEILEDKSFVEIKEQAEFKKTKAAKKITGIINKLTSEAKTLKKEIDKKK